MNRRLQAILEVTNYGGKGQAKFLRGPDDLMRSKYFNNSRFSAYEFGTNVKATFSVGKVRTLLNVIKLTPEENADLAKVLLAGVDEIHATNIAPESITEPVDPEPIPVVVFPNVLPVTNNWLTGASTYINDEIQIAFETAMRIAKGGGIVNVLMVGASGYGKTSIPKAIANVMEMECLRMNCAAVRDPEEWFGYREAQVGSTVFVPTEFTEIVRRGNAVIILDELNRVEPWLHNTLYPLLDDDRATSVHGEHIECGRAIVFVATINEGAQFTGTFTLDTALVNRFDIIVRVGPLPPRVEAKLLRKRYSNLIETTADKIVKIMQDLRQLSDQQNLDVDVSTRSSLKISRLVCAGATLRDAVRMTIVNAVSPEMAKNIMDTISSELL